MKTVIITVEGGVVQNVEVPEGVTVIVRDYDVDGTESDLLQQDRAATITSNPSGLLKGQPMPTFEIEQYELHTMKYRVEASTEAEAIKKLFDGDGEAVDNSLEYIEAAENFGLPVDVNRELADDLQKLGVSVGEDVIPSISSIELE